MHFVVTRYLELQRRPELYWCMLQRFSWNHACGGSNPLSTDNTDGREVGLVSACSVFASLLLFLPLLTSLLSFEKCFTISLILYSPLTSSMWNRIFGTNMNIKNSVRSTKMMLLNTKRWARGLSETRIKSGIAMKLTSNMPAIAAVMNFVSPNSFEMWRAR